jgi:hypothetical protein
VGHLAAALMLKRAEPKINLGWLFFAVLLSDFLLGVFYWMGLEHAYIPSDFAHLPYITFSFPYSHGLVASFVWSGLAFLLAKYLWRDGDRVKVAFVLGAAVFSHFILDFIVHVPELPVLGRGSRKLGLGLWNNMTAALTLEIILVLLGLVVYLPVAKQRGFTCRLGIVILMAIFSLLTVVAMTSSTPPDLTGAAVSWIAAPVVLSVIAFRLDRPSSS